MRQRPLHIKALSAIMITGCLVLIIALCAAPLYALRDVRKFRGIEFRGLVNVSRFEVLSKVALRAEKDGVVVDVDSLKKRLGDIHLVKSFHVAEENGLLVAVIVERDPFFVLTLRRAGGNVPFEIDEDFRVVSAGTVHACARPLLIIDEEDMKGGVLSLKVRNFIRFFLEMQKNRVDITREMVQIYLGEEDRIRVYLNGRRTLFHLRSLERDFVNLGRIVAALDAGRSYPETLHLYDDFCISK